MNQREYEAVLAIARREGLSFGDASNWYLMYGTGEATQVQAERKQWNARVEAEKRAKRDAKRGGR